MICSKENCKLRFYARGLCKKHYSAFRISDSFEKLPPKIKVVCLSAGCDQIQSAKGLCQKHYRELKVSRNKMTYKGIDAKRQARAMAVKREIAESLGGKCSICGYSKNYACLDFHHKNPKEKKFEPKSIFRMKDKAKIESEISKCILVCKNCHGDIHHPDQRVNLFRAVEKFGSASAAVSPENIITAP